MVMAADHARNRTKQHEPVKRRNALLVGMPLTVLLALLTRSRGRRRREGTPPSSLAQVVILSVIPQAITEPNQTGLTRIAAQPDLARPNWTVETRKLAVFS
jgi:hypothetical protein